MSAPVEFRHSVKVGGEEIAGITLAGARITYGANGVGDPPEPATAFLELISADAAGDLLADYPEFTFGDAIPSGFVDVYADRYEGGVTKLIAGQTVEVGVTTPTGFRDVYEDVYAGGFESVRFTGIIDALDVTPALVAITAIAPSERLTRVTVTPAGWPQESDVARVQRIASAAGIPITVEGSAAVTLLAVEPDADPEKAWPLLVETARAAGSLVYANRHGQIVYRTRNATGGSTTAGLAASATLTDGLRMSQEIGLVLNSITVEYGTKPAQGDRPTVTVTDPDSIAEFGLRDRRVTLDLASEADARAHAQRVLDHYARPSWHMPAVAVNLHLAKDEPDFPAGIQEILELDLDDAVLLPMLLPASPLPEYESRVLGIEEYLDPYAWTLRFSLNPAGWTLRDYTRKAKP